MSSGSDTAHRVRIDELGERELIHADTCCAHTSTGDPSGVLFKQENEPCEYLVYTCSVGRYVDMWGWTDLDENSDTPTEPGEYQLAFEWYTPESMFEDAEVNLYVTP